MLGCSKVETKYLLNKYRYYHLTNEDKNLLNNMGLKLELTHVFMFKDEKLKNHINYVGYEWDPVFCFIGKNSTKFDAPIHKLHRYGGNSKIFCKLEDIVLCRFRGCEGLHKNIICQTERIPKKLWKILYVKIPQFHELFFNIREICNIFGMPEDIVQLLIQFLNL